MQFKDIWAAQKVVKLLEASTIPVSFNQLHRKNVVKDEAQLERIVQSLRKMEVATVNKGKLHKTLTTALTAAKGGAFYI